MRHKSIVAVVLLLTALGASCSGDPEELKREYVASGDQYVAQKKYAEAIIEYRNAIAKDPNFGEARLKLAAVYEATGDLRNARREYVRGADLLPADLDAQLHAGKLLMAARQFPEARARADAVLAKDSKNVNALILMGNALAGLKDLDGAIAQIEEAIDNGPQINFSYMNLGLLELRKGDRAAAEGAYKRATAVQPNSVPAHLNLGNFYWATGQRAAAEKELKTALAIEPNSPAVNRMLATFYLTNGQKKDGEPYLKTYAYAKDGIDGKLALADFYLADRRTHEAVAILEPLSKNTDGFGPARLRLAVLEFQAGRRPQAHQMLDEVLTRYPKNRQTLEAKASFLMSEEKYQDAIITCDSVIAAEPRASRCQYLRATALRSVGKVDDAIKAMRTAAELAPSAVVVQAALADLYLLKGDPKTALELLRPVVKAEPQSGTAHFLLGRALFETGDLDGAEKEFVLLARAAPSSETTQTWLGRVYGAKGDLPRARAAFDRALGVQPDSLLALNGLVTLDVVERKADSARARLNSRLAADSKNSALLFLAGNTFKTLGDSAKAESLFLQVLQIDPANIDAYGRLSSIYLSQGRLDEAKKKFEDAAKLQAKPVAARTFIGMVLEMQNKLDEARKNYEQALAIEPKAPVAANNLAWLYAERGENLDVALELAQTAKAQLPDNAQTSDTLGWVYYKKGLASLAVTAFQQGVTQNPTNPTIHYHLGLAYAKNGNRSEAQRSLEQALKLNPRFAGADDAKRVLGTLKG